MNEYKNNFYSKLKLNEQQKAAVTSVDGAVLLLAVPGSGKTTVLTARLGYMIGQCGIDAESILVLTYTVAAANEMKKRFSTVYPEFDYAPEFRTINGVAQKIIYDFSRRTGRVPFELISDEKRQTAIVASVYREITGEFATDIIISEIKTRITRAKNAMMSEEEIAELDDETPFSRVYEAYSRFLRENRLMDYDDQLVYAHTILRKYPAFAKAYASKYKYICVDEAQDTSKIQHRIIKLLTGNNGNIFMVGDEDQSIYGFRGAYPEFLLSFEEDYPGAVILKSEENFRSTPEITGVADDFINKNTLRIKKTIRPNRSDRGSVREIEVFDIAAQYKRLARLLSENTDGTVAVLYRNNECALPLIDIMLRIGGDFSCRDNDCSFFSSKTVCDVLNILRLACNGTDTEAFLSVYYKLGLFLSRQQAEKTAALTVKNGVGVLENLLEYGGLFEAAKRNCRDMIKIMQRIKSEPLPRAVFLAAHLPGCPVSESGPEFSKVEILTALAEGQNSIPEFVSHLARLRKTVAAGVKGSGRVTFSTVHSAKGLEFDTVYIICAVDGILPAQVPLGHMTRAERELYEEERRLFYVAMTRAKNKLDIFTFRADKYSMAFTDEVFNKVKPPKKGFALPVPKAFSARAGINNGGVGFTVDARSDGVRTNDDITVGSGIEHSEFGTGRVTARNGDIITAEFKNGKVRRLSVSYMVRKGIVKVR